MEPKRMRWFWEQRGAHGKIKPQECSREYARRLYEMNAHGTGVARLRWVENFVFGRRISDVHFDAWGEEVTDKELFQRILKGELRAGVKEL